MKAPVEKWWYLDPEYVVAVKRYPKQTPEMKHELGVASMLKCKHLATVLGWVNIKETGEIGIVWELYGELNLSRKLKNVDPLKKSFIREKIKWAKQIGIALHYMHSRDPPLTHGDIDCANILLSTGGDAVLCDFDRSWLEGSIHRPLEKLSLFPRFPENQKLGTVALKAIDHVLFCFFLISVSVFLSNRYCFYSTI
jgi:serine/threonine protein kinase